MMLPAIHRQQRGMALAVSLLFLLIVTVISVVAASNSTMGLKMSANIQDALSSFQTAEAGVVAVMLLVNTPEDAFDGDSSLDPFADFDPASDHPLRHLKGGADVVDVDVYLTGGELECPAIRDGTSATERTCDYYRIDSEHAAPGGARTKIRMGVIKPLIKGG